MKAEIQNKIKDALRAKDKTALETYRGILSAMQYDEIQKGVDELSDSDSLAILKKEFKKVGEELEFVEKANRGDDITRLKQQQALISDLLPKQLSDDELKAKIESIKVENSAANIGVVMKFLNTEYPGQFDSKRASELAKTILG